MNQRNYNGITFLKFHSSLQTSRLCMKYVDRSYNSSKGNQIPGEETISKLEKRNVNLLEKVKSKGMFDKNIDELQLSITEGLVKKFWVGCQG